jgi:hypothetical protein
MHLRHRSCTNKELRLHAVESSRGVGTMSDGEATTLLMSLMAEYTNEAVTTAVAVVAEHSVTDHKRQPVKRHRESPFAVPAS